MIKIGVYYSYQPHPVFFNLELDKISYPELEVEISEDLWDKYITKQKELANIFKEIELQFKPQLGEYCL